MNRKLILTLSSFLLISGVSSYNILNNNDNNVKVMDSENVVNYLEINNNRVKRSNDVTTLTNKVYTSIRYDNISGIRFQVGFPANDNYAYGMNVKIGDNDSIDFAANPSTLFKAKMDEENNKLTEDESSSEYWYSFVIEGIPETYYDTEITATGYYLDENNERYESTSTTYSYRGVAQYYLENSKILDNNYSKETLNEVYLAVREIANVDYSNDEYLKNSLGSVEEDLASFVPGSKQSTKVNLGISDNSSKQFQVIYTLEDELTDGYTNKQYISFFVAVNSKDTFNATLNLRKTDWTSLGELSLEINSSVSEYYCKTSYCTSNGDSWYFVQIPTSSFLTEDGAVKQITFANYSANSDFSSDSNYFYLDGLRISDTYFELPYLNLTNVLEKEYNCTLEDSGSSMLITSTINTVDRYYANYQVKFNEDIDLVGKELEMDVKLGDNVYKNRLGVSLRVDSTTVATQNVVLENTLTSSYLVKENSNGWYHIKINIANTFVADSYVADSIRFSFAPDDLTKEASLYMNNICLNYASLTKKDYSNDFTISYGVESLGVDFSTCHDDIASMKVVTNDQYSGIMTSIGQSLKDKKMTFYFKTDENVHKNRITLDFYQDSATKCGTQLKVSVNDTVDGVKVTAADSNGWYYAEVDCNTVGLSEIESVYQVRFSIQTLVNTEGTYSSTTWIDELYFE